MLAPWLLGFSLLAVHSTGLPPSEQVAVAKRASRPPAIDGNLSDPVWAQAVPIADFTQQAPDEDQPPSQRTEVRILFDDRAIYFAFRCFDTAPKTIVANMTRRDRDSFSDAIWLDIDTRGDHRSAYHFELSAAGVQRDGIRTGDVIKDTVDWNWDAVWDSAVSRDAEGWTAEIAIPLAELRYDATGAMIWRMEIRRFIARRSEVDQWIYIPRLKSTEMLWYGPLVGLDGVPPSHNLRLLPFILERTRNRRSPPELRMPRGVDTAISAGLDARYGVTSNLTLNATILPDFGQVEADEVKLNLTTFELNYPEKRPFFLEGINQYTLYRQDGVPQTNQLFYSRRIGAAPPGPYIPPGGSLVETASSAQILGAAKLTGRIGKTLNVAFLEALTSSETATILTDGTQSAQTVAPLSNFLVARLNQEWARNFVGGLMLTNVLHREPRGSLGLGDFCPGARGALRASDGRCTHDATTAALDVDWRSPKGSYLAHGVVYGSLISGGPPRTFRDGTTIRSGDTGLGLALFASKAAGRFIGGVTLATFSPRLDLNDAGFLPSQNVHQLFSSLYWREFNWGPTRSTKHGVMVTAFNSWDGVATNRVIDLQSYIDWKNVWSTELHLKRFPTTFDNRETTDGARTQKADGWGIDLIWRSDPTRPLYSELTSSARTLWQGYSVSASGAVVFRPSGRFEISLVPTVNRVSGDPRWVTSTTNCSRQPGSTNPDGSKTYCFGLQRVLAPGATLRTTLTFTPTMTLQTYTQLFFASVRYRQLFQTTKFGAKPNIYLSDLSSSIAEPSDFNTHDAVLDLNVVFRWEYLPGSLLYLVYTRSHAGGLAPPQYDVNGLKVQTPVLDFGALGRGPIEDVFLVKLSYYFGR